MTPGLQKQENSFGQHGKGSRNQAVGKDNRKEITDLATQSNSA
jgi:hypothetical protein